MILAVGEILFDQFPRYRRIGGAPFNFCFHLMRFGLPVRFVSRVGDDDDGQKIVDFMEKRGFPAKDIQVDPKHRTGLVRVELSENGVPDFEIVADVAYDHISYEEVKNPPDESEVDLIYFGTVIQRTDRAHQALHEFIAGRYPRSRVFLDINLRTGCVNDKALRASLQKADILKLNGEELDYLKNLNGFKGEASGFVPRLMSEYRLEMLALTHGAEGSEIFTSKERAVSRPGEILNLADTVGAGDAYAALVALGVIRGWPLQTIVERATRFAASICEIEGAVPESSQFYPDAAASLGL